MSITLLTEAELCGICATHRTKRELLEDAEKKDVHRFLQIDGWEVGAGIGDMIPPDGDGICIMSEVVDDLRRSGADLKVRVQISKTATIDDVIAILKKMVGILKIRGDDV